MEKNYDFENQSIISSPLNFLLSLIKTKRSSRESLVFKGSCKMQHLSEILSFFLIQILFVKGQFGPIFSYENGEYWGASRFDDTLGIKIPHGRGTYVSNDKSVKFNGEWKNGEPFHGTRYYKV